MLTFLNNLGALIWHKRGITALGFDLTRAFNTGAFNSGVFNTVAAALP
jgi:hypothetical protein